MKLRRNMFGLGLILLLFVVATLARASDMSADFWLGGTTSVSFDGSRLILNVPIAGAYNPTADDFSISSTGTLTLTTGAFTNRTPTQIDFSDGTFTLWGTFKGSSPAATLLSGTLGTSGISVLPGGQYSYATAAGALTATTISSSVANYYWHFTPPEVVGGFNIGFSTQGTLDLANQFSLRSVGSGDFQVNPVPIAGSLALFAPALAGLAVARKRIWG